MNINRQFKDSVFTRLFNNPASLRELYNALGGVSLPPDVPVSINTLENVLYMDVYNDISFEIGGRLVVLVEHQSTINQNMALRFLLYYARVLEKTVAGRKLYAEKRLPIPWPEFYVLYNGRKQFPDTEVLRLSDLFESAQELGLTEKTKPFLDLEVKVININEGRNDAVVSRCKQLSGYSAFIAKVRSFEKEGSTLEESIKKAVIYCCNHDILKEFMEIHGSEVLNMLLTEWNWDDCIAVRREEGREEGLQEGLDKGLRKGLEQGRNTEKYEIARKMKEMGDAPEKIQIITGLSAEAVGTL